jgi:hypothetical protein
MRYANRSLRKHPLYRQSASTPLLPAPHKQKLSTTINAILAACRKVSELG